MKEETYNKWHSYGQSKTANMLMAISLAEKLGPKRGLLAFSVHPGVVFGTSLASHLDMETDIVALRKSITFLHCLTNDSFQAMSIEPWEMPKAGLNSS